MSMQVPPDMGGAAGAPPATPNAAPQAPAPVNATPQAPVPQALPVSVPQPVGRTPTRKLITADGEEIPNDADLLEIPPTALKGRLERYTKKQLRDAFGTDDVDTIKARLSEHEQWREEREQKRIAELSEVDRYKEQLAAAQAERDAAVERAEQIQTQQVVSEQDSNISAIMGRHFNPRYMKHEMRNLAEYIQSLPEAELGDPDAVVEAWCRKTVEEDPALGIPTAVAPVAAPQAAPPPVIPPPPAGPLMTNGGGGTRPQNVNPNGIVAPKTFAPGHAGSASDKEWREFKRQQGWHF